MRAVFLAGAAVLICAAAGPISKFDDHRVKAEFDTAAKLEDVERCMMDLPGMTLPQAVRQPDRPNNVTLLWSAQGAFSAPIILRADLARVSVGTHVKAWLDYEAIEKCAPRR